MVPPSGSFAIDRGRIRIGDELLVYLERAKEPDGPLPPGVAGRPHGVAPMATSAGAVVAAVAPGEAVWLGFQAVDRSRPVTVRVRLDGPQPVDAVTGLPWQDALTAAPRNHLVCPPETRLVGVPHAEGYRPFGTGVEPYEDGIVEELTVIAWVPAPAAVAVRLIRPDAFTALTGELAPPLDPDSAFKGHRLP